MQRFVSDIANDAINYARFTAQANSNLNRIARQACYPLSAALPT